MVEGECLLRIFELLYGDLLSCGPFSNSLVSCPRVSGLSFLGRLPGKSDHRHHPLEVWNMDEEGLPKEEGRRKKEASE